MLGKGPFIRKPVPWLQALTGNALTQIVGNHVRKLRTSEAWLLRRLFGGGHYVG
jgi:hypothetical protein